MKNLFLRAALIGAMLIPSVLHATPLTGQFSVGGTVTPTSTTLTFLPGTIAVGYGTQTGSFMSILTDGEFATAGTPVIVYSPTYPGGAFVDFTNLDISILSISAQQMGVFTLFTGNALFTSPGYTNTYGTFSFSTQGTGPVTFSATGLATAPTPEPASLVLMGTAALAGVGLLRKKFAV